jgi:hypothetical protein
MDLFQAQVDRFAISCLRPLRLTASSSQLRIVPVPAIPLFRPVLLR